MSRRDCERCGNVLPLGAHANQKYHAGKCAHEVQLEQHKAWRSWPSRAQKAPKDRRPSRGRKPMTEAEMLHRIKVAGERKRAGLWV